MEMKTHRNPGLGDGEGLLPPAIRDTSHSIWEMAFYFFNVLSATSTNSNFQLYYRFTFELFPMWSQESSCPVIIGIENPSFQVRRTAVENLMGIHRRGDVNHPAPHECHPSHPAKTASYLKPHESNAEKRQCSDLHFSFLTGNNLDHFQNQVFSLPNKHSQNILQHGYDRRNN